jgi:type II secretory pathway pseudopilin PulG
MNEGGDQKYQGFTIVETLIVLAVTGILFFSAVALVNGRQNKTQFSTAINNLQQQIQQIINETQSGYYGDNSGYRCSSIAGRPKLTATAVITPPSGDCQFIGKFIQFGTDTDSSKLIVYPMVGSVNNALGSTQNTTINASQPSAVAPLATSPLYNTIVDGTQSYQMEQGLTVANDKPLAVASSFMNFSPPASFTRRTTAIGFLVGDKTGTFATVQPGGFNSGSLPLTLYGVNSSTRDMSKSAMTALLNPQTVGTNLIPATSASFCIASGSTDQSGLITITGGLSVSLEIKSGLVC